MDDRIRGKLELIYGTDTGVSTFERLRNLVEAWRSKLPEIPAPTGGGAPVDSTDAFLITYGDQFRRQGESPLKTLGRFAERFLTGLISGIHILPFSPYSSDDGFSVMDYRQVNPDWGSWQDISAIASHFRLMADLVLNHCSAEGTWFRSYLRGEPDYAGFFIEVDPATDLSAVFRPRALPLLHEFVVTGQSRWIWTTFSADQVDLNFANPDVFLEFVDILLDYIGKGVRVVRLDAVGFLWKEVGTACMHHPKTHQMVKLFRLILSEAAPGVVLITETNVPHAQNIAYFGDGSDEAHMVYQFSLPPLTLDAFICGDATPLTRWAQTLPAPNPENTFFNFLASHDGIGVLPARGFLNEYRLENLIRTVQERGGLVSYKATPEGEIPYELNISYFDAIAEKSLNPELRVRKFLASQAVMLSLAGVPGIYVHSLIGSGNWAGGVGETGMNRSINREKLLLDEVLEELDDPGSLRHLVFRGYSRLLAARRGHPAFSPSAGQTILELDPSVFSLIRSAPGCPPVLCLISTVGEVSELRLPEPFNRSGTLTDIITAEPVELSGAHVEIEPWGVLWLELR